MPSQISLWAFMLSMSVLFISCQSPYNQSSYPSSMDVREDDRSVDTLTKSTEILPTILVPKLEELDNNDIEIENTNLSAGGEFGGGRIHLHNPVWSHNGQQLAYKYDIGIWVVDTKDWQEPRLIYDGKQSREDFGLHFDILQNIAWSPDDSMLAFTLYELTDLGNAVGPVSAIYDFQTDSVHLISGAYTGVITEWNDQGILVCHIDEIGCGIINIDGEILYPLGVLIMPRFLDESHIMYNQDGNIVIFNFLENSTQTLIGTGITPPLSRLDFGSVPVVSPDGRWIVWLDRIPPSNSASRGIERMFVYDIKNNSTQEILNSQEFQYPGWSLPSWSPSSSELVFEAGDEIWILHINNDLQ